MAAGQPHRLALLALLGVIFRSGCAERYAVIPHRHPRSGEAWTDGLRRLRWRRFKSPLSLLLAYASARGAAAQYGGDTFASFDRADLDNDGLVDQEEFLNSFALPGHSGPLHGLFGKADLDGDGRLCPSEMEYAGYLAGELLFSSGGDTKEDPGYSFLAEFDSDQDGYLDLEEFLPVVKSAAKQAGFDEDMRSEIIDWSKEAFEKTDINRDGRLDGGESKYIMYLMQNAMAGGVFDKLKIVKFLFGTVDANKDGLISKKELDRTTRVARRKGIDQQNIFKLMRKHFDEADMDGNELLDADEMRSLTELVDLDL